MTRLFTGQSTGLRPLAWHRPTVGGCRNVAFRLLPLPFVRLGVWDDGVGADVLAASILGKAPQWFTQFPFSANVVRLKHL